MVATAFPDPAKVRQTAFDQQLKLEQAKGLIEIKKKEIEAQAKATERGARPLGSARQVVGEDGKPHWVQFIQDPNGRVIKEDLGEAPSSTQKLDSTQQLARDLHSEDKSTSEIAQAKLTKLLQPPKTSASRSSKGGSSAGPSGIAIPDDALRTLARREITQGLKPSFGLSAKDPNRAKYNRILAEEYAKDPDAASALADYKSGTSSLMQLQKLKAQIGSFDKAFNSDLANAREASEAVSRSDVRRFNSWQQFVQADLTDNPKLAQLRVAAQTAVNQYARLMYSATGGGTSTDSARKDAESLLSSAMAKGSFNAALAQMEKEAKNRIAGINDQISDQQEQMNKRSPGASKLSPPSPKGPPPKTADEYLKSLTQ